MADDGGLQLDQTSDLGNSAHQRPADTALGSWRKPSWAPDSFVRDDPDRFTLLAIDSIGFNSATDNLEQRILVCRGVPAICLVPAFAKRGVQRDVNLIAAILNSEISLGTIVSVVAVSNTGSRPVAHGSGVSLASSSAVANQS